jgi:hypothetical protein
VLPAEKISRSSASPTKLWRARSARFAANSHSSRDPAAQLAVEGLYCDLGERVIDQARRRVLQGEQVPNAEKIYSIFESRQYVIALPAHRVGEMDLIRLRR